MPQQALPTELVIHVETGADTTALVYPATQPTGDQRPTLILGHGAGVGQRSAFMVEFAHGLAARGIDVVTFNFLYTEQQRRIPDRLPRLIACYAAVIASVRERRASARGGLFIGGKSMGGRVATHVAAADRGLPLAGVVLLGYPLHPPGYPDRLRDAHLPSVGRPQLFVQGSRDTFGLPAELRPVLSRIAPEPTLHIVEGGDHSFQLARKNPTAQADVYFEVQRIIAEWISKQAVTTSS